MKAGNPRGGDSTKSVTDTRSTTDRNDLFLNMGSNTGKSWLNKNGAKCNEGFGRTTKNTPHDDNAMRGVRSTLVCREWVSRLHFLPIECR